MASLAELHAALVALEQGGRTAKLYFYFTEPGELRQRSGFFFIDKGRSCHLSLEGMDPDSALARVPRLAFSKVAWLPAIQLDAALAGTHPFSVTSVIERLDPARQPRPEPLPVPQAKAEARFDDEYEAAPAAEPAAPQSWYSGFDPGDGDQPAAPGPAAAKPAHVFYSHLALQRDSLAVLEAIYGLGVSKKLASIANTTPPHQYPAQFLAKCREHAALMLGEKKARELFKTIEDKVAAHLS
jgi:hypothetical protein